MIDDCGIYLLDDLERIGPLLLFLSLLGLLCVICWWFGEFLIYVTRKRRASKKGE